jgi:hypothetical protein
MAVAAGAIVAGAGLGACSSSSSAGALAGRTPAQIVSAALAAARSEGTVHFTLNATGSPNGESVVGNAGLLDGQQELTIGTDQVEAELISGVAYLDATPGFLHNDLGLPATVANTYAGKWISLSSSDALYSQISQSVTLNGILKQVTPTGSLQASSPGLVAGRTVIGVIGGLPGPPRTGTTGRSELYVETARPNLPVGFSGEATSSAGARISDVGSFRDWGGALQLSAPPGAVPYDSLPKS